MFRRILIAGRGETAVRIIRTCREMGIESVCVHSEADARGLHTRLADHSVCIGPGPASGSYLNVPHILSVARMFRADALHPGIGFLSENAEFARLVEEEGMVFIGPSPEQIALMADKESARRCVAEYGLPLVPGLDDAAADDDRLLSFARETGFPVLLKAVHGGGGRGMRVVRALDGLVEARAICQAEARASFASDRLFAEKYLEGARHIEFQVAGDGQGGGVHFFERDCSLQRRHQKVIEESPSPGVSREEAARMGALCAEVTGRLNYRGLGTMEFLWYEGTFYFIEMNARLQVEHPVTEAITSLDLVAEQIRIAAGEGLSMRQEEIVCRGVAIECRINAENPETFVPSPGRVDIFHPPGGTGVRVDSALYSGAVVPPYYDSLIAKLIVDHADRPAAVRRLRRALHEVAIVGVECNVPLLLRLTGEAWFAAGDYHTTRLEEFLER